MADSGGVGNCRGRSEVKVTQYQTLVNVTPINDDSSDEFVVIDVIVARHEAALRLLSRALC